MITAWEGLDQAGLISELLPGWERLRSLPQRDPIHLYTVDRHLMQTAVNASALVRRVSRPDLLLLAAIFHDIGKGLPGDHSTVGAEMIPAWLGRLGVAKPDIEVIRLARPAPPAAVRDGRPPRPGRPGHRGEDRRRAG